MKRALSGDASPHKCHPRQIHVRLLFRQAQSRTDLDSDATEEKRRGNRPGQTRNIFTVEKQNILNSSEIFWYRINRLSRSGEQSLLDKTFGNWHKHSKALGNLMGEEFNSTLETVKV